MVRNYVPDGSKGPGENPLTGAVALQSLGCVKGPSGMAGALNHVEIHVSQSQLDVYATDAGTTAPLKHIAVVPNANLTFYPRPHLDRRRPLQRPQVRRRGRAHLRLGQRRLRRPSDRA